MAEGTICIYLDGSMALSTSILMALNQPYPMPCQGHSARADAPLLRLQLRHGARRSQPHRRRQKALARLDDAARGAMEEQVKTDERAGRMRRIGSSPSFSSF
jgi:hypothetical protein